YPQDLLSSPLDMRAGVVDIGVGDAVGGAARDATPAGASGPERPVDPVTSLIAGADLSALGVLIALLVACGLGVVHAVSPGHGKTVIAAYLVGTNGSRRQALVLGLVVALSHTAGVLVLGAVTLAASTAVAPERLYPYLSTAAGVIVLFIGATLVRNRIRSRRHGHVHTHEHATGRLGWRPLLALGFSGGIVPSAS